MDIENKASLAKNTGHDEKNQQEYIEYIRSQLLIKKSEYSTYIYKKSKNKKKAELKHLAFILGAILICIIFYLIRIPGIGLITIIMIGVSLFKIKTYTDQSKGINRHGSLGDEITISENSIKVREAAISFDDIEDLTIYVNEYAGMPKTLFGEYHGGNNEITFKHKGQAYSIYYFIPSKTDFYFVEQLVERIETKQKGQKV